MRTNTSTLVAESSGLAECLDRLAAQKHDDRPVSTYRLQFNRDFRFGDARALLPYLSALGISHCYASPLLKARAGSQHGYDITDHNAINPEIGTEQEFHEFVAELKRFGMGLILDTVPNHMGVGQGDNPWWQDVLQNGRASTYAEFFDIDWEPLNEELTNRVLYPILGGPYGQELEEGKIRVQFRDGQFSIQYYDKRMPIDPQTVPLVFEPLGDLRVQEVELPQEEQAELENVLFELRRLPPHTTTDPQQVRRRQAEAPALLNRLADLAKRSPQVRHLIERALETCNGQPGDSHSFDPLHRLLDAQPYRLAHWMVSGEEINYRRFFDINELIGLRMENPKVFAATHRLMRKLLGDGSIAGVRVDHPDGLLNPGQHFTRLQMLYAASQCCGPEPIPPLAENGIEEEVQTIFGQHDWMARRVPLYVLVEKILQPGEELPDWPVDGTVGYEFGRLVNGIFIDSRNERAFNRLYERVLGGVASVEDVIYNSKKLIVNGALASEVAVLTDLLGEISTRDRRARDFTLKALRNAIRETIACFPVYRTYIDERGHITETDRARITSAIARAKRRNQDMPSAVFEFLRNILLLQPNAAAGNGLSDQDYRQRLYFVLKFQQLSGPAMAKGLEDTACYVYNRFVAVNEVGGSPRDFGVSVEEFHQGNQRRAENWPNSLLSTSTHDSKRSEDVRARLDVLSEMPSAWSAAVMRWRRMNREKLPIISDGRRVPDANEEYLLYQTLVGAWPFSSSKGDSRREFTSRIQHYMNKAVHEAKVNLSWINDNPEYIAALNEFIARILQPGRERGRNSFLAHLENFIGPVAFFGALNSLAQVVLKVTSPGVPDVYQGNELWEFRLVDPDNRYPVDFEHRQEITEALIARSEPGDVNQLCRELLADYHDGRIKLWTTMRAMRFRREHPDLFKSGSYIPLRTGGEHGEHFLAFARSYKDQWTVVAVPRLAYSMMKGRMQPPLAEAWGNTELELPSELSNVALVNVFTGEVIAPRNGRPIPAREIFGSFPVSILASY
ncbi:MAG TPA: malto-oligosyltrehalose synthase [Terriglobales bacterium]|nr:malto-oligosyltrehalose synthase [Terriglobales bacterium]